MITKQMKLDHANQCLTDFTNRYHITLCPSIKAKLDMIDRLTQQEYEHFAIATYDKLHNSLTM